MEQNHNIEHVKNENVDESNFQINYARKETRPHPDGGTYEVGIKVDEEGNETEVAITPVKEYKNIFG